MLLTIDSGNSKLKARYYHPDDKLNNQFFSTDKGRINYLLETVKELVVQKVVYVDSGGYENRIENAIFAKYGFIPFNARSFKNWNFQISYGNDKPGIDRLVCLMAASTILESSIKSFIVVTMGTCITFNAVMNGIFSYGYISPGLQMRFNAMHQFTSALPQITLSETVKPDFLAGGTTQNLINGVMFAVLSEITSAVKKISNSESFPVYITGGQAFYFKNHFPENYQIINDLNFLGLKNIANFKNEI